MRMEEFSYECTSEIIDFFSHNIPTTDEPLGWQHMFSSAYQMGCMALVALGHAEDTGWGAIPLKKSVTPIISPRWDDICVAVLVLARHHGKITYKSSSEPTRIAPNISAFLSLGTAFADPDVLSILRLLGLVNEGSWTEQSEIILWRVQPKEWEMDIASDRRISNAIKTTVNTIPEDIRYELERLVKITQSDVQKQIALSIKNQEDHQKKFGPKARTSKILTTERAMKSIAYIRQGNIDWLFYRRWRLIEGWLSDGEAKHALDIFHDPLAIAMRRNVLELLYPNSPITYEW